MADVTPPNEKLGEFRPELVTEFGSPGRRHAQGRCISSRRERSGDRS
jgi:hypothetical protein